MRGYRLHRPRAVRAGFACTRNSNRSLAAPLSQRKFEAWSQFAYNRRTAFETALRLLETPFTRKDPGRDYHYAVDLLRARLLSSAKIVPLHPPHGLH